MYVVCFFIQDDDDDEVAIKRKWVDSLLLKFIIFVMNYLY